MEIRPFQPDDSETAFAYWRELGDQIPYFFEVSARRWRTCLLADERDGECIFETLNTDLAIEDGRMLGFLQVGRPAFAWNESGRREPNPRIGVVRQLYFRPGRKDAGEALWARAQSFIEPFVQAYAFYHALGMGCTAHHGKLHASQAHVHRLLLAGGFRVEHENAYYVLDVQQAPMEARGLRVSAMPGSDEQWFRARLDGEVVGTAEVRYLDRLTDGCTRHTAYLTWFGVNEAHRREGLGGAFLGQLVHLLRRKGYRTLHTDTARDNSAARGLYEKLGFEQAGFTRSYVRQDADDKETGTGATVRLQSYRLAGPVLGAVGYGELVATRRPRDEGWEPLVEGGEPLVAGGGPSGAGTRSPHTAPEDGG